MGITVEQGEESNVIRLEGAIDIASAAELKSTLLSRAQSPGRAGALGARFDHADLDVTAIQLLWAAEREAKAQAWNSRSRGRYRSRSRQP